MSSTAENRTSRGRGSALMNAALAFVLVAGASWVGSVATLPNIPGWYASLNKPPFNPPNWVFGPVWTVLYAMIAYAFWRVLQKPADTPGRNAAIGLFVVQIVLNALWSVVFFGMHDPRLGLVVVVALEAAVIATGLRFRAVDQVAGWPFVPYAAWVAFATVLNLSIVILNR
jgi:tryptophan-rich sensory protein